MLVLIHEQLNSFYLCIPMVLKTTLFLCTIQKDYWRLQCEVEEAGGLPYNSSDALILPGDQRRLSILLFSCTVEPQSFQLCETI